MDIDKIEKGYEVIERAICKKEKYPSDWIWYGVKAADIALKVLPEKKKIAFKIYELLLEIWKGETTGYGRDESHFRGHEYNDLLFKHYNKIWEQYPSEATKQLLGVLEKYYESADEDDQPDDPSYHLYITIEDLGNINNRYGSDYVAPLLQAICKEGRTVIEKEPEKVNELLKLLQAKEYDIFK